MSLIRHLILQNCKEHQAQPASKQDRYDGSSCSIFFRSRQTDDLLEAFRPKFFFNLTQNSFALILTCSMPVRNPSDQKKYCSSNEAGKF